jgi:hypothetical protein
MKAQERKKVFLLLLINNEFVFVRLQKEEVINSFRFLFLRLNLEKSKAEKGKL